MPPTRTISAVVERFVERRRSDPSVTPEVFASEDGAVSDDEWRALQACVHAEALFADGAAPSTSETGPTATSDLLEGRVVGDFRLLRPIGRGGSGVVYLSEQLSLGRPAAVKVLHPTCASSPAWRARFLRESSALSRLNHPNIVTVLSAGEDSGILYLAMVLVEGEGLDRRIHRAAAGARCALDPLETARVGADLASALSQAHERGLVHRDIKPSNILVTASGHPYLVDFGLARWEDRSRLTETGDAVGTPLYMAPEQLDPAVGEVDARTDVFGIGLSLLEASTGWVPGAGGRGLASSPFAAIRPLPRDLGTVLLRAIDPEPRRRYPDAAALRDDFQRFLDGAPVMARRAGLALRSARFARRRPLVAASAAVAIIAGSLLAGWWWDRSRSRDDEVARLRVDAALSMERGDVERADRESARLRAHGIVDTDLDARIDRMRRAQAAARAVDAARAGVFNERATIVDLRRTRDLCDEALRFYEGRDTFEPLILKSIALFRLTDLRGSRAAGLAAAASRQIPLEGEVLADLDGLAARVLLKSMSGGILKDVQAGSALASLSDAQLDRLRRLVLDHAKDSPELAMVAGFFLDLAGRPDQSLDLYDRVLDLNPRHPLALVAKANSRLSVDDVRAARDAARTAVAVAPERASSYWVLARVHRHAGQIDDALRCLDEALAREPTYMSAWLLKAEIFKKAERREEAVRALEAAARINPGLGLPIINRADDLVDLKRWDEALTAYRATIGKEDVRPGHARAGEGKTLFFLGRYPEALVALDAALDENSALADAWYSKSKVLHAQGALAKASEASLTALRLGRRLGSESDLEEYQLWYEQLERDRRDSASQPSAEDLEAAIAAELPELRFDEVHLRRWIDLACRRLAAGDSTAALKTLEDAGSRAVAFARKPGTRLDRSALRAGLAETFEQAMDLLDESGDFEALRAAEGYAEVAASWRRQIAAWR